MCLRHNEKGIFNFFLNDYPLIVINFTQTDMIPISGFNCNFGLSIAEACCDAEDNQQGEITTPAGWVPSGKQHEGEL